MAAAAIRPVLISAIAFRTLWPKYVATRFFQRRRLLKDRPHSRPATQPMRDLADLYPGCASHWIDTSVGKIFARAGGSGPPLMLLHGYAQTNVMWHKVADELAKYFTLVIPDLPGYGWSAVPDAGPDHAPYTKRAMAAARIDVMEALGHARFNLAGHDRGGRVAYRLALDHPGRLIRLATLDIVPTYAMWHDLDARLAYRIWHWTFLALPAPGPEDMIGRDP